MFDLPFDFFRWSLPSSRSSSRARPSTRSPSCARGSMRSEAPRAHGSARRRAAAAARAAKPPARAAEHRVARPRRPRRPKPSRRRSQPDACSRSRRRTCPPPPPLPQAAARLRGAHRHPLGGLGRRPDAGARRLLHGALFDRGRPARPRRAHLLGGAVRAGAAGRRRMDPAQGKHLRRSPRCRSPISRRSSPRPARRSRSRPSMPPMRSTVSSCPPPPSSCSAWSRSARSPPRCCTGRRWPASASSAPSSRRSWSPPTSRITGRSTSISPSSPPRRSGWRASGCGAGSRSPPSRSRCSGPSPAWNAARRWSAPHVFHVIAGFVLAALLVVCGFMFGPPAEEGQIEPISSGSLAAYLFGATLIVLTERAMPIPP